MLVGRCDGAGIREPLPLTMFCEKCSLPILNMGCACFVVKLMSEVKGRHAIVNTSRTTSLLRLAGNVPRHGRGRPTVHRVDDQGTVEGEYGRSRVEYGRRKRKVRSESSVTKDFLSCFCFLRECILWESKGMRGN